MNNKTKRANMSYETLELTCKEPINFNRTVYSRNMPIDLNTGDEIVIMKADNLPNNENEYWVTSINDDTFYGEDPYGYLVYLDSLEIEKYFE